MTILVDDRGHEPPLIPYFAPYGLEVESLIMDSSDIWFAGNGPNGTCSVAIERKRISDLVNSMRSERFSGFQLDGLLEFDYPMLLIEGIWRPNPQTGMLEVWGWDREKRKNGWVMQRGRLMYSEVDNFVNTFRFICGLQIIRTSSPEETAKCVVDMAGWFGKEWSKHKAHLGIYAPVPERNGGRVGLVRRRASLAVKIAAQLPGVDQKAWQVGEYFGHQVRKMIEASSEEWMKALGIKKGRKSVDEILRSIRG